MNYSSGATILDNELSSQASENESPTILIVDSSF